MLRPLSFLALFLSGCALQPSELSLDDGDQVLVKCCRIPADEPLIAQWAVHTWIDLRLDGEWKRVEVVSEFSGVAIDELLEPVAFQDERWDRRVDVIASFAEDDDASRIASEILELAPNYPYEDDYDAWPGPNSNTFVEWLSRGVDGFAIELYPNAEGKDYRGLIGAGVTTTRLGLELETTWLGAQVGLQEGVELHLLGFTLGVGLWPPSLKLPLLPALPWDL
ncbi:MAG: DUF3750 domain-containing protein [Planctomycetota bacterium]